MADGKQIRLEQLRRLNETAQRGKIVLAGSSLCEQFPVNEMLMSRGIDLVVYNRGISGDTLAGYREKLDVCVCDLQPAKVFINIGTNDMNGETFDVEAFAAEYEALLCDIIVRCPGTEITVLAFYPMNEEVHATSPWHSLRTNERIRAANRAVEELARGLNLRFVDCSAPLVDKNGSLHPEFTMDGIHMYADAYEKVLDILLPYMTE